MLRIIYKEVPYEAGVCTCLSTFYFRTIEVDSIIRQFVSRVKCRGIRGWFARRAGLGVR